ncbi:hypothetical protein LWI28_004157 [Acer negundo]|uniref:Uncharacterized protein n=1 Tax=Acer negundo TaxID=4023 RepID=A0AAD5NUS0_ACENE|nr:hypothetical protein LWI28_004157 [Acer negundo]
MLCDAVIAVTAPIRRSCAFTVADSCHRLSLAALLIISSQQTAFVTRICSDTMVYGGDRPKPLLATRSILESPRQDRYHHLNPKMKFNLSSKHRPEPAPQLLGPPTSKQPLRPFSRTCASKEGSK